MAHSSEECFNFDFLAPDDLRTMAGRSGFDNYGITENTLSFTRGLSVLGSQPLHHFSWPLPRVNTASPGVSGPGNIIRWTHVS